MNECLKHWLIENKEKHNFLIKKKKTYWVIVVWYYYNLADRTFSFKLNKYLVLGSSALIIKNLDPHVGKVLEQYDD